MNYEYCFIYISTIYLAGFLSRWSKGDNHYYSLWGFHETWGYFRSTAKETIKGQFWKYFKQFVWILRSQKMELNAHQSFLELCMFFFQVPINFHSKNTKRFFFKSSKISDSISGDMKSQVVTSIYCFHWYIVYIVGIQVAYIFMYSIFYDQFHCMLLSFIFPNQKNTSSSFPFYAIFMIMVHRSLKSKMECVAYIYYEN